MVLSTCFCGCGEIRVQDANGGAWSQVRPKVNLSGHEEYTGTVVVECQRCNRPVRLKLRNGISSEPVEAVSTGPVPLTDQERIAQLEHMCHELLTVARERGWAG